MITISAQRFLDDAIVEEKVAARDFIVSVSPSFEIDGVLYRLVLDGHHSLAAAKAAAVDPEFVEQDARDNDTIAVLDRGNVEEFMIMHRIDSDYYDIVTGVDVW